MKLRYNKADNFIDYISSEDALFHYTQRAVALENILYKNSFKFSYLRNTNDPYEYKDKLIGAAGWCWDDATIKNINETEKIIDNLLTEQTLFISFCANKFEGKILKSHGFLKSRMWSQYGENHKGICLVFSKEKLSKLLRNQFVSEKHMIFEGDVEYKEYINDDSGHDSLSVDHNTFDENTPETIVFKHVEKYHRELLFRKQRDYKDEQEYRFVILLMDDHLLSTTEPLFTVNDCLKSIILGDRFPEVYKPAIESVCDNLNIAYTKLHWESGDYFLLNMKQS